VNGLVLSLIPLAAVILGLTILKRQPSSLFAMGYVVEGPLMLLLVIRFFVIRQATLALTVLMVIALLGMAAFSGPCSIPTSSGECRWVGLLMLAGLTLMLLTALYAALWIAFMPCPHGGIFQMGGEHGIEPVRFLRDLRFTWRDLIQQGLIWIPFSILGFLLLVFTSTLFVLAPIAVPVLSARPGGLARGRVKGQGWAAPLAAVLATILLSAVLFVVSNRQPQQQAFALLQNPPASPAQAQALLQEQESIRRGLLNAYLAPFRYISSVGEVRHVREIYRSTMGMTDGGACRLKTFMKRWRSPVVRAGPPPGSCQHTITPLSKRTGGGRPTLPALSIRPLSRATRGDRRARARRLQPG
jgi:putative PEP-CTERM system integral membrane protein